MTYSVFEGGALFRMYLDVFSSYGHQRMYRAEMKLHRTRCEEDDTLQFESEPLLNTVMENITDEAGGPFTNWLIQCCANLGEGGKKQLWYYTFIAKYFGLSRVGIMTNAAAGLGVTMSYFDDRLKLMQSRIQEELQ
jgi:hypothetical protein